MTTTSLIFDVKRYAIHDGPGIRITIFFKGCPLSCVWCHNPEGILRKKQKLYFEKKCIGAQECVMICPEKALSLTENGIITDPDKCTMCGECAEACPTMAIQMSGKALDSEDVMKLIKSEVQIMDQSGGGVTFSGGEPLHHHQMLLDLLKKCGENKIHRCVDTTGFAKQSILMEVAKHTDLFLYDLKHMDPEIHQRYTGVSNKIILENLITLSNTATQIIIRIPLIKGVNDDYDSLNRTGLFIASLPGPILKVQLIPYHPIAESKYKKLGQTYEYTHLEPPDFDTQNAAVQLFESYGIPAEIGG